MVNMRFVIFWAQLFRPKRLPLFANAQPPRTGSFDTPFGLLNHRYCGGRLRRSSTLGAHSRSIFYNKPAKNQFPENNRLKNYSTSSLQPAIFVFSHFSRLSLQTPQFPEPAKSPKLFFSRLKAKNTK